MANIDTLLETIGNMTVLELVQFKQRLQEEWGITDAMMMPAQGNMPTPTVIEEEPVEQTLFTVVLTAPGQRRIDVIKIAREVLGLSLKEAKDVVDKAPVDLAVDISQEEADTLAARLRDVGAETEIK